VTELIGATHGESVPILSDALVCSHCGFKTIPAEKMAEFALRIADAYRARHGLLTSSQIKDRRLDLGMSQQQFSSYLGVGSSSVKRWELGSIQDKAMNDLMLLKTDVRKAEANVQELIARLGGRLDLWTDPKSESMGDWSINALWEWKDSQRAYARNSWACGALSSFPPLESSETFGSDIADGEIVPPRELVA
jgi:putative zinc finger/helix-turn-helix YgiT family protein